jgi:hypothetical protein
VTAHWLDAAEARAETPLLRIERDWLRQRRDRLIAAAGAGRDIDRRVARAELQALTLRLLIIDRELSQRGMT